MSLWSQIRADEARLDACVALLMRNMALAEELSLALSECGAVVRYAAEQMALNQQVHAQRPDIVIIDADQPESAIAYCRSLTAKDAVPVILLGSSLDERARLEAYDAGVDMVVAGPIYMQEIVARVRSVLWRTKPIAVASRMGVGVVAIDLAQEQVSCCGTPVYLRPSEKRLLNFFLRNPTRVISRQELADSLFPETAPDVRTVDQYVCRLRLALCCKTDRDPIRTVLKSGYALDPEQFDGAAEIARHRIDRRRRQLKVR